MSSLLDQLKPMTISDPSVVGLPMEILDGKKHPCPNPSCQGGSTPFRAHPDFISNGRVLCTSCTDGRWVDVINWYGTVNRIENSMAIQELREKFRISPPRFKEGRLEKEVKKLCENKSMPFDEFMKYKPVLAEREIDGVRKIAIRIKAFGTDGKRTVLFDLIDNDKGRWQKKSKLGFFCTRLPEPGERWLIVEGVKDQCALGGLGYNAMGFPSCSGWQSLSIEKFFRDVDIIVIPDGDEAGRNFANAIGEKFSGIARSIKIARLPVEIKESGGQDVRDVLREKGESTLRAVIARAEDYVEEDTRQKIKFRIDDEFTATQQVIACLSRIGLGEDYSKQVFQRNGQLVQVVPCADDEIGHIKGTGGMWIIRKMPAPIIRERIGQSCRLFQIKMRGEEETETQISPPSWLVDAVEHQGHYKDIRNLTGIIHSPTIRMDGSILQNPGWDDKTGLLYIPNQIFPGINEQASRTDAIKAYADLLEPIREFQFKSLHDSAAWICLVLSLVCRNTINGCVPMFGITANSPGSGKGLLAKLASLIAFGRPASHVAYDRSDQEMRKRITSVAVEGFPLVVLDNISETIESSSLDSALTSTRWVDRKLGYSETIGEIPIRTVWVATGNNLTFGGDLHRRVLPIRLESQVQNPEERVFDNPDVIAWTIENRPQLVNAAITIVKAFFNADQKQVDNARWGSFEEFQKLIRGAVIWLDKRTDPNQTREFARENDRSSSLLSMLISGLDGYEMTARELCNCIEDPQHSTLAEAVSAICGSTPDPRKIGAKLKTYQGKILNGKRIKSKTVHGGALQYFVEGVL